MGSAVQGDGARGVRTSTAKFVRRSSTAQLSPLDKAKPDEVVWGQVNDLFNAARDVRLRGDKPLRFVYVMSEDDEGPVKIGVARNPIDRLRNMRTGNPRRLRLEYVLLGDETVESLLHELWEPFNLSGEWFRGECRPALFPILHDAAAQQVVYLRSDPQPVRFDDLRALAFDAHGENPLIRGRDSDPDVPLECGRRVPAGDCCQHHMTMSARADRHRQDLKHLSDAKDALARAKANGSTLNLEPLEQRLATTERKLSRK